MNGNPYRYLQDVSIEKVSWMKRAYIYATPHPTKIRQKANSISDVAGRLTGLAQL